ncbi:hypothetical protein [Streptomyces sp. NPDC020983]|uniref:hypothetical protein n=1 Tax=Streptomyces sp. NPDC020983 TaxID=3365106 RepID=UPI003795E986
MIKTTYRGRELKILKSATLGCVKTFIGGKVISHADPVNEVIALDALRLIIDRIDVNGVGNNPTYALPYWYAPGTFDTNHAGHAIAPGGACVCNTCLSCPEKNVPRAVVGSCQHCHLTEHLHGRQYTDLAGWHQWTAPTPEQTKGRMLARRAAA